MGHKLEQRCLMKVTNQAVDVHFDQCTLLIAVFTIPALFSLGDELDLNVFVMKVLYMSMQLGKIQTF